MELKDTTMTRVLAESHRKVSIFATDKSMLLPDAYEVIVNAGLKALNYRLPEN